MGEWLKPKKSSKADDVPDSDAKYKSGKSGKPDRGDIVATLATHKEDE